MTAWVAAVGGMAGLDRTAFGQMSLAHPFIAGSVCALLTGSAVEGVRMATVLTMLASVNIPVGENRIRDWTSASVIGVALGASLPGPGGWGAALIWAVLWARPAGWLIEATRTVAARAMDRAESARRRADLRALDRLHLMLTSLQLVRGVAVTLLGLFSGRWLLAGPAADAVQMGPWLAQVWELAPWAAVPVLCRVHGRRSGWGWCLLGAGILAASLAMVEGWRG